MAAMSPPSSRTGIARPGLLSRLLQVFAGSQTEDTVPAPPLFAPRPVPPPEPRGPGLPPLDEILREAPPPPDPDRQPRLTLVDFAWNQPAASATPAPPPPPAMDSGRVVAKLRAMLEAGMPGEARKLLDAVPDIADEAGRPLRRVLAYRCAVAANDMESTAALAAELRPTLDEHDPLLEVIIARTAVLAGNPAVARTAWLAALHRAPGLPEAAEWLERHPVSPDGGVPVDELIAGPRPRLDALPPLLALTALPDSLPPSGPAQWLRNVAIRIADGAPSTDAAWDEAREVPAFADNDVAVVLRDPDDIARPAGFAETALAVFALARGGPAPLRIARLYAGRQPWAARASESQQAELLAVLFPGLRVTAAFDGALRERAAIAIGGSRDAGTGTLIGGLMPQVRRHAGEARARVYAALDLPNTALPPRVAGRKPQALLLEPSPGCALSAPVRERLLALLERHGLEVASQSLETLPWREQVRLVAGADLLIGVHGRALAPVIWAHAEAKLLEIFPRGVRRYDIQLLAEAAGIGYLGVEAAEQDGFVTRPRERFGPPTGHAGGIVTELPWTLIDSVLAPAPAVSPG